MAQPLVLRETLPGATATTGRKMPQIWTPMVAWVVLAFLALVPTTTLAQSLDGGSLGGKVVDAFGGLVVGARVEARNDSTSIVRWTRTDQEGKYRIAELSPGVYHVQISGPGFAPSDSVCTVQLGRTTEVNISLYVGGPHEAITVKGDAERLDATSSSIATNVDQGSVDSLPSNGRRWSDFALLTPAAVPDQDGNGLVSFRGTSPLMNNSVIDGADNNQAFFSEERGRTRIAYSTSQSAVQEFQVNASNYSAEFGRAAGGVVTTITRSGGNALHGQVFYYDRSSNWAARNPFTTLTSKTADGSYQTVPYKPLDMRYQGGFRVGGPIRPQKLFWFLSYDQHYRDFPGVARALHPDVFFAMPSTASLQMLGARTGTSTDTARINYSQVLDDLAGQLGVVGRTSSQTVLFPKIDWQRGERNHFAIQYNRLRWDSPAGVQTAPAESYGITSFGNDNASEDWIISRWNFFLTPNLVNEVRYQYGRDSQSEFSQQPTAFEESFSHNRWGQPPQVEISTSSNGFTIGKPAFLDRIAYPDERRNQIVDTATWVHRRQVVKLGYDYNHINDYVNNLYNQTGTYNYINVLNFAADLLAPNHCDAAGTGLGNLPCYTWFTQAVGPAVFEFSSADYAAFFTDEWKATRTLTVSIGVRYEYERLPNPQKTMINADFPQTAALPHDKNNFGPRFGFAWDAWGSGRTVLRGGYGVYFGRIVNSTAFSALTTTGSTKAQRSYYFRPTDVGPPPFPYSFGAPPATSIEPNAVYFDSHFQNPQVQQAELSLEQSVGWYTSISVSALGSMGRELPNFVDGNIDLSQVGSITYDVSDATGRGPIKTPTYTAPFFTKRITPGYQQVTNIYSETNSRYLAGVVHLRHAMHHGVQFQSNYTYSHATDFNQNESTFADGNDVLDPRNFSLEYGNSRFDVRQRVTGGAVLASQWKAQGWKGQLLNNYSLAPVAQLQTGLPYTLRTIGSIPSIKIVDQSDRVETVSGLGASINGSGGDNRLAEIGRNTFRYPPTYGVDLRATKRIAMGERFNLEILGESFNLINHRNATRIDTAGYVLDGAPGPTSSPRMTYLTGFGSVTNANSTTLMRERQVQLAIRLNF
jgi:Carboxypeptidase regulatory-like domain